MRRHESTETPPSRGICFDNREMVRHEPSLRISIVDFSLFAKVATQQLRFAILGLKTAKPKSKIL
jgi:hypothetical protein